VALAPEKWLQIDLDVNNPAQLADAFQKVAEAQHVSLEHARALGFWRDSSPGDNLPVAADTGATQSGLFIWQGHLASGGKEIDTRLVGGAASIQEFKSEAEQTPELRGMWGRNSAVTKHMRKWIEQEQAAFSDRLVRALSRCLRVVFKSALGDMELWNKSASAQLNAQMRKFA